jgi:hypothetical protein
MDERFICKWIWILNLHLECIYGDTTFSKYAQSETRLAIAVSTKPIGPIMNTILDFINLILNPDSF